MVDPPGEPLKKTIDGQPVHKKVFNITNYERNANQNHSELSPHTCFWLLPKRQDNKF